MSTQSHWKLYVIAFVAVILCVVLRQPITGILFPLQSITERITPYLDEAKAGSDDTVELSVQEVRAFFDDAKKNSRSFAESAMGWKSKGTLILDKTSQVKRWTDKYRWLWSSTTSLPPIDLTMLVDTKKNNRNEEFLKQEFENKFFSTDQLVAIIKKAVTLYIRRIEDIENNMLTRMREDLPDLPESCLLKTLDVSVFCETFHRAVERHITDSQSQIQISLAGDIGTLIAGEVFAMVAIRLGISAGVLGTGAGSSLATLGVGLVAAIIVDYVVSCIWDWYTDPKGELAAMIDEQLDTICEMIIEGTPPRDDQPGGPGLRQKLLDYSSLRSVERKKVLIDEYLVPAP